MALASLQGNQAALPPVPGGLPKTQAEWQTFANTLQQWRSALQTPRWFAPTFQNGWVNYGGEFEPAGFYIDPAGWVRIRGLVKSGTLASPIFTLPTGYVPAYTAIVPVISNDALAEVRVAGISDATPGAVTVTSGGSSTWVSLSGIAVSTTP